MYDSDADRLLRLVTEAIARSGAASIVHCCAARVPVALLAGAGFGAISFDAALARPDDQWGVAFESGVDLWPGAVPATGELPAADDVRRHVDGWFKALGFDDDAYGERTVITPACGLAAAAPNGARTALTVAQQAAATV